MKHKLILLFTILLLLISYSIPVSQAGETKEFPLNLLFSRQDIPRIIENTKRPIFKEFWRDLLKKDFQKDHDILREAFIYAVTGDKKHGENARQGMLELLKRKRWDYFVDEQSNTVGFLRAGRHTVWMALGYDWCYDLFSPSEREEILKQIAEKGCVPLYRALHGFRHPETVKKWDFDPEFPDHYEVPDMSRWPIILGNNNFRAVISGGLALGIFTLWNRDERVSEWYDMLLDSYNRFVELFTQDGSYDEGVSYCNYAMSYLMYLMEVVERKQGINLFDRMNFLGMMEYDLALFMPHYLEPWGSVNFGDAGNSLNSSVGYWVARKSRDGLAQYIAMNYSPNKDVFSLVYYDPTVKPVPPTEQKLFKKLDVDWIVTRTGFEIDDLVVAMRSGPPTNHEHADRNSIILKAYGEILLADHKHPTYDPNHPGWFLRTGLGHNTVLIDGKGHQYHKGEEGTNASQAAAKLVRWGRRIGYDFWASDATPAYALVNKDVRSVTRTTLVFHDVPFLIVIDRIEKATTPSEFAARWHVENSDEKGHVTSEGNSFLITRPYAKFYAVCAGSPDLEMKTDFLPLPKDMGSFPYVDVTTKQKAKIAFSILAGTPLKAGEAKPNIEIQIAGADWLIKVVKGGSSLIVKVLDQDELPEFEVIENDFVK